jgi:hypothetical protein
MVISIVDHPYGSPSGNIQGTFREHSGNIQGTFREHSGNIQRTFVPGRGGPISPSTMHMPSAVISTVDHPKWCVLLFVCPQQGLLLDMMLGICMVLAGSVLAAAFSVFLVWEKSNNAKHLQMVSGVNKIIFWTSSYLWDMVIHRSLVEFTIQHPGFVESRP